MAGGAIVNTSGGKLPLFVLFPCFVAVASGLIVGFEIGISGGVTSKGPFLKKFFPEVYGKEKEEYCTFDSQLLASFTSFFYLAALIAYFCASLVTKALGRKWSMFGGSLTFLVGAALNGAAENVPVLIFGRVVSGIGAGFVNQSVPVYMSEMTPARLRETLIIIYQLMIAIGILYANLINYGTDKIKDWWGWRVSLPFAAIITLGSLFLPDTPNSLIDRGYDTAAKDMLCRIRGTDDISEEYNDLLAASKESKQIKQPWANILKRKYRPQLTMSILIPFFQQLTGINVIMLYAPVLFKTIGFGSNASLMSAVIIGFVNVCATFVSIFTVDKLGRRNLFFQSGAQMLICQIIVGTLIAIKFGTNGEANLSKTYAVFVVLFICIYVAGFAWSWGPLGWLVPSEIFPLEIRSAGQTINVSVNMFFTFLIAQAFLAMLCHMKFGLFYFFAGWVVIMTTFINFFLPETKGVPIEEMVLVWKAHWFWGKFIADSDIHVGRVEMANGSNKDNKTVV